jgi:hypothetical protein
MKKLFTLAIFFTFIVGAFAQCVPDPSLNSSGLSPKMLADGKAGVMYNEVITFQFPSDTTIVIFGVPQTIHIDTVIIQSVTGFPSNFTKTCNVPNCTYWNSPLKGCMQISGMPQIADTGVHRLKVSVIAKGKIGGTPVPIPVTDSSVLFNVKGYGAGLSRGNIPYTFGIEQITPNPFTNKTTITIVSPKSEQVTLQVHDILGKILMEEKISCKSGPNNYLLNADELKPGYYLLSVASSSGVKTRKITKR